MSLSHDLIGPGHINTKIKEERSILPYHPPPYQIVWFIQKFENDNHGCEISKFRLEQLRRMELLWFNCWTIWHFHQLFSTFFYSGNYIGGRAPGAPAGPQDLAKGPSGAHSLKNLFFYTRLKGPTGAHIGGRAPGALGAPAGALSRIKKVEQLLCFNCSSKFKLSPHASDACMRWAYLMI